MEENFRIFVVFYLRWNFRARFNGLFLERGRFLFDLRHRVVSKMRLAMKFLHRFFLRRLGTQITVVREIRVS